MQPAHFARSSRSAAVGFRVQTMSETRRRPPGFSTRIDSRKTASLSGERLITQLEMMTSNVASGSGIDSISPFWNSTFFAPTFARLRRASSSMSSLMSRPTTRPSGPTCCATRKQSNPLPLPRSSATSPGRSSAIAVGLPQPSENSCTSCGSVPSSSALYSLSAHDTISASAASSVLQQASSSCDEWSGIVSLLLSCSRALVL